jgi:hypothetical protein
LNQEFQEHMLKKLTDETKHSLLDNDYKILSRIDQELTKMAAIKEKYFPNSSLHDSNFKKYAALELFTGIKLIQNKEISSRGSVDSNLKENDTSLNLLQNYNIMFLNLLDDCLNSTENDTLTGITMKLSADLMNRYQTVFKRRKQAKKANNSSNTECVMINNLSDFQVFYENYIELICCMRTKQEIEEAKKKYISRNRLLETLDST